ncbi:hypothetical protein B4U80_11909, partial [Leptotrombidium deliense]
MENFTKPKERKSIEKLCDSNEIIKAATPAFGKFYVFTESYVVELQEFREYDLRTSIPFRISSGFPKETGTVFSDAMNVAQATFTDTGLIALRNSPLQEVLTFNYYDSDFKKQHPTDIYLKIAHYAEFETVIRELTELNHTQVPKLVMISRFRNNATEYIQIVSCVDTKLRCFKYVAINTERQMYELEYDYGKIIETTGDVEMVYNVRIEANETKFFAVVVYESDYQVQLKEFVFNNNILNETYYAASFDDKLLLGCPPVFCESAYIDALLRKPDASVNLFVGTWYFKWEFNQTPKRRKLIEKYPCKIGPHLDAAFVDSNSNTKYFFKDNIMVACSKSNDKEEFVIKDLLQINQRVDAAFYIKDNTNPKNGFAYLFTGQNVRKYSMPAFGFLSESNITTFIHGLQEFVTAATTGVIDGKESIILVEFDRMLIADVSNFKKRDVTSISAYMNCQSAMTTSIPIVTTSVPTVTTSVPIITTLTTSVPIIPTVIT